MGGGAGATEGRRGGLPPRAPGLLGIISQVTATSRLSVLTAESPREPEARRGAGRPSSPPGDLVRSDFFLLFKRILSYHLASPAPPQYTAHNGFCFVFTISPPTNHLSDQFYLRPPPYFPLPPPPSKTPFFEVRHFTNHICCFSNCDLKKKKTLSHGYSSRRLFLPFPLLAGWG